MIKNLNIHKEDNGEHFFGIEFRDNEIHLTIPSAYRLDTSSDIALKKDILIFLKTLNLTKTRYESNNLVFNKKNNDGNFALNSYLWLILDFLQNGLYKSRDKITKKKGNGRINWKKTLQQTPMVSNGNLIFNDYYVDTMVECDNLLQDIHKVALKRSIEYVGWLFDLNPNIIQTKVKLKNHLKEYLYIINRELKNTFDDVKKMRLEHILNALTGVDMGEGRIKSFGSSNYHCIFEKMNDLVFSSLKTNNEKDKFKASYTTFLTDINELINGKSKLNPDTILIKNNVAYILDSKMYQYGISKDPQHLPASDSVQKQVTYADFINNTSLKTEYKINEIRNAFIIPYDMKNNNFNFPKEEIIQYVGYSYPNWRNGKEEYFYVYIFLIDLRYLIHSWNKLKHDKEIDLLINKIEDAIIQRKQSNNIIKTN